MASRLANPLRWLLILLPALLTARLIHSYAVNIPFLDDFMFTPMYEKARGMLGGFTLHDFFIVQMEHRLAWPRLMIVVLDHFFPGNFAAQCWLTYGLLVLTLVNICLLLNRTGKQFSRWWFLLALASAMIFSPVHYMVILWPMMFQVASPTFGLTLALAAVGSRRLPVWLKFIIAILGAMIATLSIASGILIWILLIPMILWGKGLPEGKPRWLFLAAWLLSFAVTAALYFHDLKNETDPQFAYQAGMQEVTATKGVTSLLGDPGRAINFVLEFVGGSLCRGTTGSMRLIAKSLGALLLGALFIATIVWWRRFRKSDTSEPDLIPWISLALYSPGTGALVAVGRAWATTSGDNSLQARYTIHAVPLSLGIMILTWILVGHFRQHFPSRQIALNQFIKTATAVFITTLVINWSHGRFMMETWSSSRLRAAANTQFFKLNDMNNSFLVNRATELCSNKVYAKRLDDIGLLNPPMVTSDRLDQFKLRSRTLSSNTANLEQMRLLKDSSTGRQWILAEGEGGLGGRKRVADAIVFAKRDPDVPQDPWTIFHIGQITQLPLGLSSSLGRDMRFLFLPAQELSQVLTKFGLEIPLGALPKNDKTYVVTAYAFDFLRQEMFPMEGIFRVNLSVPSVVKIGGKNGGKRRTQPDTKPSTEQNPTPETSAK